MSNPLEILNRDLADARERIRRGDQLGTRLLSVEEDLWVARKRLEPLEAAMKNESADVRRLEGLGLTALFYTMLGSKEQQLAKERQEALAAKLKHDEAAFAVAALADEERRCKAELDELFDANARYQKLLESKEKILRGRGKDVARRLVEISDRVGVAKADLREIDEALAAGLQARTSLDVILDRLSSAEGWGSWDLRRGGFLSSSMKHSYLDDAREEAHRAQQYLRTFGRELRDIGEQLEASLAVDGFTKFADWFFDGLIVDWLVQKEIHASQQTAAATASRVRRAVDKLEARQTKARERLTRAEEDRKDFIEKS